MFNLVYHAILLQSYLIQGTLSFQQNIFLIPPVKNLYFLSEATLLHDLQLTEDIGLPRLILHHQFLVDANHLFDLPLSNATNIINLLQYHFLVLLYLLPKLPIAITNFLYDLFALVIQNGNYLFDVLLVIDSLFYLLYLVVDLEEI